MTMPSNSRQNVNFADKVNSKSVLKIYLLDVCDVVCKDNLTCNQTYCSFKIAIARNKNYFVKIRLLVQALIKCSALIVS